MSPHADVIQDPAELVVRLPEISSNDSAWNFADDPWALRHNAEIWLVLSGMYNRPRSPRRQVNQGEGT